MTSPLEPQQSRPASADLPSFDTASLALTPSEAPLGAKPVTTNNNSSSNASTAIPTSGVPFQEQKTDGMKILPQQPQSDGSASSTNANAATATMGTAPSASQQQASPTEEKKGLEGTPSPAPGLLSKGENAAGKTASLSSTGPPSKPWHKRSGQMYAYQTADDKPIEVTAGSTAFVAAIRKDDLIVQSGASDVTFVEEKVPSPCNWRYVINLSTSGAASSAKYHCYVMNVVQNNPVAYAVTRHQISEIQAVRVTEMKVTPEMHAAMAVAWQQHQAGVAPSPRKSRPREDESDAEYVDPSPDGPPAAKKRKTDSGDAPASSVHVTRSGIAFGLGLSQTPPPIIRGRGRGQGGTSATGRGKNGGKGKAKTVFGAVARAELDSDDSPVFFNASSSVTPRVPFGQLSAQQLNQQPGTTPPVNLVFPIPREPVVQKLSAFSGELKTPPPSNPVDVSKIATNMSPVHSPVQHHDVAQQIQLQIQQLQQQWLNLTQSQQLQHQSNQMNINPTPSQPTLPTSTPTQQTFPMQQASVPSGYMASLQSVLNDDDARYWRNKYEDQRNREHELAMARRQQAINQFQLFFFR